MLGIEEKMRIEFSKGVFEAFHYNVEQRIGEVAAGRIRRVPMCACVCFKAWRSAQQKGMIDRTGEKREKYRHEGVS